MLAAANAGLVLYAHEHRFDGNEGMARLANFLGYLSLMGLTRYTVVLLVLCWLPCVIGVWLLRGPSARRNRFACTVLSTVFIFSIVICTVAHVAFRKEIRKSWERQPPAQTTSRASSQAQ